MKQHKGHEKHLCKMIIGDMTGIEKIKPLVNNAQYICKACGRVANKKDNICAPARLFRYVR